MIIIIYLFRVGKKRKNIYKGIFSMCIEWSSFIIIIIINISF